VRSLPLRRYPVLGDPHRVSSRKSSGIERDGITLVAHAVAKALNTATRTRRRTPLGAIASTPRRPPFTSVAQTAYPLDAQHLVKPFRDETLLPAGPAQ